MTEHAINRSVSWDVDEGIYEGTFIECGHYSQQTRNGTVVYFRLVFQIDGLDSEYFEYRAQKRYSLKDGYPKDLPKDLERWSGREPFDQNPNLGWNELLGTKAKLVIKHRHDHGYRKPFVYIQKILPVKKLSAQTRPVIVPRIEESLPMTEGQGGGVDDFVHN
jgi:hypothetical protein